MVRINWKSAKTKFLVVILVIILFPAIFKSLRFDLIHGGDHLISSSISKEESIHRGVYLGELRLSQEPLRLNNGVILVIKDGWIEKVWRSGYWYWTTIDKGDGYRIRLDIDIQQSVFDELIIKNDRENGFGYEKLNLYEGSLWGVIDRLPESDTISYFISKRDIHDFSEYNTLGELKMVFTSMPD